MLSFSLREIETNLNRLQLIHGELENIYLDLESRPYSSRLQIQFKLEMKKSFESVELIIRQCKLCNDIGTANGANLMQRFKKLCLKTESLWRRGLRIVCKPTSPIAVNVVQPEIPVSVVLEDFDAIFLSNRPREVLRKRIIRVNGDLEYLLDLSSQTEDDPTSIQAERVHVDDNKERESLPTVSSAPRVGLDPFELEKLDAPTSSSVGTVLRTTAFAVAGGAVGMMVGGPVLGLALGAKAAAIGAAGVGVVGIIGGAGYGVHRNTNGAGIETLTSAPRRASDNAGGPLQDSNEGEPLLELTESTSVWDARPDSFA